MPHTTLSARGRTPCLGFLLVTSSLLHFDTALAATIDIPGPAGSVRFGDAVTVLPNGNIVVLDKGGNGAAYLYSTAGKLLGSLKGSNADDFAGARIVPLSSGNFVVVTPEWDGAASGQPIIGAGAVTFVNGTAGLSASIGPTVSLVGSHAHDRVGGGGVTALSSGAYVVCSYQWDSPTTFGVGAATWGSGIQGVSGEITQYNSLIGSSEYDAVCSGGIVELSQGRYVVMTPSWDNGASAPDAGAATWGGANGAIGVVGTSNSLVGSQGYDYLSRVAVLSDGDYVVYSESWHNADKADAGAAAWVDGDSGLPTGSLDSANALVGASVGDGLGRFSVTALTNGNYVVAFPRWNNGAIADAGGVFLGSGSGGTTGEVTAAQALVGTSPDDRVGDYILPLTNGNYVVISPSWSNGVSVDVGAATWMDGLAGAPAVVSTANSIHGQTTNEFPSGSSLQSRALADGNFALVTAGFQFSGAVTWNAGSVPTSGPVDYANALVGVSPSNDVATGGVLPLPDGGYLALSDRFDCTVQTCGNDASDAGAITRVSPAPIQGGILSNQNSAVGLNAQDKVGTFGSAVVLPNGDFVVACPACDFFAFDRGVVSYFSAAEGTNGHFAILGRSLLGDLAGDAIGSGGIKSYADGSYVIYSPSYHDGQGAVTAFRAGEPLALQIGPSNSIIGSMPNQGQTLVYDYDTLRAQLVVGQPMANKVSLLNGHLFADGFEDAL